MSRHVKLTDDTVYQVDRCGADEERLRLRVTDPGFDMLTAVQKFGNPELTATIEHFFDGTETDHVYFKGYTVLESLLSEEAGMVVSMKRAASDS